LVFFIFKGITFILWTNLKLIIFSLRGYYIPCEANLFMIITEIPSVKALSANFAMIRSKDLWWWWSYFSWKCLLSWSLRLPREENGLSQWEHLNGFSPVCSLICTFRLDFSTDVFGQKGHLYLTVCPWLRCFCLKWLFSRWYLV